MSEFDFLKEHGFGVVYGAEAVRNLIKQKGKETMTEDTIYPATQEALTEQYTDSPSIVPEGDVVPVKLDEMGNPINTVGYIQVAEDVGDESIVVT